MKITAYKNIGFKESQNFLIESIENYLTMNGTGVSWDNVQKITPNIDISFRLSAKGFMSCDKISPFEYIKLETNDDDLNIFYYFVRRISRVAENTVLIDAHLDSINTFQYLIENGMSRRTLVKREHHDRFVEKTMGAYPRHVTLGKQVDDASENLSPLKFQTSKESVESTMGSLEGVSFYLIYKTINEIKDDFSANPVDVFCCASIPLKIAHGTSAPITWTVEMISDVHFYYVIADDGEFSIEFSGGYIYTTPNYACLSFRIVNGKISANVFTAQPNGELVLYSSISDQTSITFNKAGKVHASTVACESIAQIAVTPYVLQYIGIAGDLYVMSFDEIDRTDSRLVKILKLPYAPCVLSYLDGVYSFPQEWSLSSGLMKLAHAKLNQDFINYQLKEVIIPNFSYYFDFSTKDAALLSYRGNFDDSKLLHSDFHSEKLTYDSFSLEFPLEKVMIDDEGETPNFNVEFHQSNTINSNLFFKITPNYFLDYNNQDFGDYLLASRNNEEPIFTNAYLNYIRTGYNYDKKTKALSATARWTGTAASIIGGALSAGIGAATGHPVLAATGVTMIAGGLAQLTSSITSQISDENSLQSKLSSLAAQGSSVAGCDDIDLMSNYAQNKLLYFRYDVSDKTKALLNDLFYYYGYNVNRQKQPDINSRVWFNFLECNPDWLPDSEESILGVYETELNAKLNSGITIMHAVGNIKQWDLSQNKENWEKWIVE